MGWSIKKPFGSKKSIFNQAFSVAKAIFVAPTIGAVSLVSKDAAANLNEQVDAFGQKELLYVEAGAKIGAGVIGGALLTPAIAAIGGTEVAADLKKAKEEADKILEQKKAVEAEAKRLSELAAVKAAAEALKLQQDIPDALKGRILPGVDINVPKPIQEVLTPATHDIAEDFFVPVRPPLLPATPAATVIPYAPAATPAGTTLNARKLDWLEQVFADLAVVLKGK